MLVGMLIDAWCVYMCMRVRVSGHYYIFLGYSILQFLLFGSKMQKFVPSNIKFSVGNLHYLSLNS